MVVQMAQENPTWGQARVTADPPAREMAFRDSIDSAAEMMRRIDSRWPEKR